MWLTFVDEALRNQVIKEYIREMESEFVKKFRQQEVRCMCH